MKKKYLLLSIAALTLAVTSCDSDNTSASDKTTEKTEATTGTGTVSTIDVSAVTFTSLNTLSDGESHALLASNIPSGVKAVYKNNNYKDSGTYFATCDLVDEATDEVIKTLKAVITVDNEAYADFSEFTTDFFTIYLGDDYYAWNVFANDPTSLGFDRTEAGEASWYSYGGTLTSDDKAQAYAEFKEIYDELVTFADKPLSSLQKASYKVIFDFCEYNMEVYSSENDFDTLMDLRYVDSFGGYVADFSSSMQGYNFRTEYDIIDAIDYIESTTAAFPTYVDYVNDRYSAGYALSDSTLDEMISYLDDISELGTSYYLYELMPSKVNSTTFLSDEAKASYSNQITQALTDNFLPAVESLSDSLEACKGKLASSDEGYFAKYDAKEYYKLELEDLLGLDLDIDNYMQYLKDKIEEYNGEIGELVTRINGLAPAKNNEAVNYINGVTSLIGIDEAEDMIPFLKKFARSIVPNLKSTPNIILSEMDATVAAISTTVAYYTKSTVDYSGDEKVTINPVYLSDDINDTLSTLSHEGYPGHLYSYVHAKESGLDNVAIISGNTGQGEGWATYVQLKLYEYISRNYGSKTNPNMNPVSLACSYLYYNQLISYLLYTAIDCGISYYGWSVAQVASFMNGNGFNGSAAKNLYDTLIEMPTTYAAYGYGMVYMLQLHLDAEAALGNYYNEVEFNENVVLKEGEAGLGRLKELADAYVAKVKFLNGIE